jgi:aminomethyltransferase
MGVGVDSQECRATPLDGLHRELGARMAPFAGYAMPINYPAGILKEHLHCRDKAGLFDVSHMGQVKLTGANVDKALETLIPGDIVDLPVGRQRYSMFTNDSGGILDDLMVARADDHLFMVVNAACKAADIAHMQAKLTPLGVTMEPLEDRALLALQGAQAAQVLARFIPGCAALPFMGLGSGVFVGVAVTLTRSGYTGEDGFEISCPADAAEMIARKLLAESEVAPIGLGARDSLRLEAGLCLYGHDIDETTTPIEAGLAWSISKRRRAEGGFPGAAVVQRQSAEGVTRRRVGIRPEGRQPAREGVEIVADDGRVIGIVTSGGFGPSLGGPMAMGYVETAYAAVGTKVTLPVRGKPLAAEVVKLPFVAQRYYRGM